MLSFYQSRIYLLSPEDETPQRERKTVSSSKMMLTIVWNLHGFHMIDVLPKGSKFNAGYYISHIRLPLLEIFALYQDDPK
jgi:hypothetical protein